MTADPIITWARDDETRCPQTIAGHRCIYPRWHRNSCGVLALSDTGLSFAVTFGQAGTSGAPNVDLDGVDMWDRACEIAAILEQQLAAIAELHSGTDYGLGEDHHVRWCTECDSKWPCATARVVNADFSDDAPVEVLQEAAS